jgi:acyl-CoA synthetase (AMP-forming)/AMP-acid ligase II
MSITKVEPSKETPFHRPAYDLNLAYALGMNARNRPMHPAIIYRERTISYRDFNGLVLRTASWLQSHGVERGEIIGVGLGDTIENFVSMFALAALGAIVLPMDVRWTLEEKVRIADRFQAKIVLLEEADMGWSGGSQPIYNDAAWQEGVAQASPLSTLAVGENLPFVLSLSSGTTGLPKGPLIGQQQSGRRFWTEWINLGFNATSRYLSATPLYFGGGRGFGMCLLHCGGTVVLFPPPYEPEELVEEVRERDITAIFLVPTLLRRLLAMDSGKELMMPSLRVLVSSGSPLHPDERKQIRERITPHFYEMYATTESGAVSLLTPDDQILRGDSVGRAVFGVEAQVVDDNHRLLSTGEIGRVRYRGPGSATGFYNDPESTARMFKDGWFYPGDYGTFDEEGYLFLKGRREDIIIRGGVNIYPDEIEQLLLSHPAVVEAAAVAQPSKEMGEEVAAFVIAKYKVTKDDLVEYCRARIAPYKVPRLIYFVEDMPKSAVGKILKTELMKRLPEI